MNHQQSAVEDTPFDVTKQEQVILIIAARLLDYPPENMEELKRDVTDLIEEEMDAGVEKEELQKACTQVFRYTPKMIRELYVSTFDLKSSLGLYLTSHEYGDSPKRGVAIINLQRIIKDAGYERVDDELADYIPMLLELLVAAPETAEQNQLHKRLAIAVHRMLKKMEDVNPYIGLLRVLNKHVLPKPTDKEIAAMENMRENADLEELPFPLLYQ